MFAYCGNEPVLFCDAEGMRPMLHDTAAAPNVRLPYDTLEDAAAAAAEEFINQSLYIRHEYITEIYVLTVNGVSTYGYNTPRNGKVHSAEMHLDCPKGAVIVAYVHSHHSHSDFSWKDINLSNKEGYIGFLVGPDMILKSYNPSTKRFGYYGQLSPCPLTDFEKEGLQKHFKSSWLAHKELGCDGYCNRVSWPSKGDF